MTYQVAEVLKPADSNGVATIKLVNANAPSLIGGFNEVHFKESNARNQLLELELTNEKKTYVIVSW